MKYDNEELLTVREVARRCQRSEETVRRWIWSGKLPARKLGNQLYVRRKDIEGHTTPTIGETAVKYGAAPRYTKEEMLKQIEDDNAFREKLRRKYGYFDVAADVRRSRDEH